MGGGTGVPVTVVATADAAVDLAPADVLGTTGAGAEGSILATVPAELSTARPDAEEAARPPASRNESAIAPESIADAAGVTRAISTGGITAVAATDTPGSASSELRERYCHTPIATMQAAATTPTTSWTGETGNDETFVPHHLHPPRLRG